MTLAKSYPAPVAELTNANGQTVEGVFLRVATAPQPIQMINPLAPPQYGSARNLVVFSELDYNRSDNSNKPSRPQPTGVRFLSIGSIW